MATVPTKLSLKLLVDTKSRKVLFAEAEKGFADFLFNLLSLPIGSVITILSKQGMVGSLGKLYESVETLSDTYRQISKVALDAALLKPTVYASAAIPRLLPDLQITKSTRFYGCGRTYYSSCYNQVSYDPNVKCTSCGGSMYRELKYCSPEEGYVKGVVTYMIMDDLQVRPMLSGISTVTMIKKLNIKDIGVLEEKVVEVGMDEGVELLKASLYSKSVLTEVFLEKKSYFASVSEVD